MSANDQKPASTSTVTVTQLRNGKWTFVLKFRGVTHPAQGMFATQEQAETVGKAALRVLETRQ